jgi:polar amino acid transport system substrate-binding protein
LGLASMSIASDNSGTELGLVSDKWPPFTDVAGQPRYAVELVHEALRRSGVEAKTSILDWSKVTKSLQQGKFDGSAAMWRNSDRDAYLLFSEPMLENRLVLVGRKGSDVSASSLSGLNGKRIALVAGYAYGDEILKADGPKFVEGPSHQANFQKLLMDEVDYLLIDELVMRHVLVYQHERASAALSVGTNSLGSQSLHFALRKELPNATSILRAFNSQIAHMRDDGTYHRILRLRWIETDIDNDGTTELVLSGTAAGDSPPTAAYSVEVTAVSGMGSVRVH